MGNSNSSSTQVGPANWSHSLEPPDQQNRMKKSYFPPRHYMGGRYPPQKVLPSAVNPGKAARRLKATSNGAILHGGGTISGRKLLNELDLSLQDGNPKGNDVVVRKKSNSSGNTNEDTGISTGISTPNLSSMEQYDEAEEHYPINHKSNGHNMKMSSRDYDSDPESPITLISESPAKKQISKKKYQAPPPPFTELSANGHYFRAHGPSPEPESKKKMHNRIFKTKAESKTKQALALELERKIWENKKRKEAPVVSHEPPPALRWLKENPAPSQKTKQSSANGSKKEIPNLTSGPPVPKVGTSSDSQPSMSNSVEPGPTKSFYFGMDMGDSHRNNTAMTKPSKEKKGKHDEEEAAVRMIQGTEKAMREKATLNNGFKSESSKGRSVGEELGNQKISQRSQPVVCNTKAKNNSEPNEPKSDRPALKKSHVPSNKHCESDSDGLHCRQDSGSFELVHHSTDEKSSKSKRQASKTTPNSQATIPESWSSDLSSSEMDIPLLLRPTLPLKRTELPRFSPSAAWRALDSPRPSEQSLSSEEGFHYEDHRIQRHKRPVAPPSRLHAGHHERSGDSGISAGDGGSPANPLPEISPPAITKGPKGGPSKCWTPEQDLDESSSEFEPEDRDRVPSHHAAIPIPSRESTLIPTSIGPRTPPKLTTRSHLFSQKYGGGYRTDEDDRRQPLYARSTKAKGTTVVLNGESVGALVLPSFQRVSRKPLAPLNSRDPGRKGGFRGLDTNWFLSRSEPNSLNAPDLMILSHLSEPFSTGGSGAGYDKALTPEAEVMGLGWQSDSAEVRSEIGYGPSSMNFSEEQDEELEAVAQRLDAEEEKLDLSQPNSLILSHIMYLPAYDSRRIHSHPTSYFHSQRRTKSVDNLDPAEASPLFRHTSRSPPPQAPNAGQILSRNQQALVQEQTNSNKRKKFKFQSTLRVLERKRIEKQLAREAEEKEMERLREMEGMREVEEEFQRKRAREKLDKEQNQLQLQLGNLTNGSQRPLVSVGEWEGVSQSRNNNNPVITIRTLNESGSTTTSVISSSVNGHGAGPRYKSNKSRNTTRVNLREREEPEGAPASLNSNPSIDLRKELIHAPRKRNGVSILGGASDLTQELSEFRQTTRQYCDYRRMPRTNSASPARFAESSSSDIYPVSCRAPLEKTKHSGNRYRATTTTTVHPEIICDIPSKPFPYMINFSRLSGSTSNLVVEERPGSGMGGGNTSGPSSIVSDNYRRDWAHNRSSNGSILGGGIGGRASSIASLHSPSDNFRHSGSELNMQTDSPKMLSKSRKSPVSHKYSSSPASSPLPAISSNSSNGSSVMGLDKGVKTQPSASVGVFQAQPFNSSKVKGYRPVVFKPTTTTAYHPPHLTSSTSVI